MAICGISVAGSNQNFWGKLTIIASIETYPDPSWLPPVQTVSNYLAFASGDIRCRHRLKWVLLLYLILSFKINIWYFVLVFVWWMTSAGVPHICRCRRKRSRGSPAAVRIQFWLGSFCQHYYLDTVKEDCGLLTDSDIFHRRWVGHHCHDPWQWCFSKLWN